MSIRCSIIIRSYNEERHIGKLLEGINQQTNVSQTEIIVVDSGSSDNTVNIARSLGCKILHIDPSEFSFGRALNIGCEQAKGEFLLFASAHVYPVYKDWIEKMLQPFINPKVALVYGRQIGNEVTRYSEKLLFKKWFPAVSNYNQRIPFCNNANTAVRKSLWKEQPYDEELTGLEDLDWAKKIQEKGHLIAYESTATIVHVHEETPARIKNRYRREAIALKSIFPEEKFAFWNFIKLSIGNIWSDCIHALRDGCLLKEIRFIIIFRTLQFWGTYKGYLQRSRPDETLRMRFYYPNELRNKQHQANDASVDTQMGDLIIYNS